MMKVYMLLLAAIIYLFVPELLSAGEVQVYDLVEDSIPTFRDGFLSIRTTEKNCVAILDSGTVYTLPVDSIKLKAGSHHLIVQNGRQWNPSRQVGIDTMLNISSNAVNIVNIPQRYSYTILSEPSGALVSVRDMKLGTTPLSLTTDQPMLLPLVLSLSQFESKTLEPPLKPVTRVSLITTATSETDRIFGTPHSIRNYSGWIYGSIASGVIFGTVSALTKHKANIYDERWRQGATRDSSFRDKSNTFDVIAASSLLITEISFGVLSYLLLAQ